MVFSCILTAFEILRLYLLKKVGRGCWRNGFTIFPTPLSPFVEKTPYFPVPLGHVGNKEYCLYSEQAWAAIIHACI
jgi:hypothetical protein